MSAADIIMLVCAFVALIVFIAGTVFKALADIATATNSTRQTAAQERMAKALNDQTTLLYEERDARNGL